MQGPGQRLGGPNSGSGAMDMPSMSTGLRLGGDSSSGPRRSTPDPEDVRRRRMAFLDKMAKESEKK